VKKALTTMAQVLDPNNMAPNAIQTDFPGSVTQVFSTPPKAAMVFEGDFVAAVITAQTKAKPKVDFNEFAFPSVDGQGGDYVVGGGDIVCMFKDSPAARAFVKYLATPRAAELWAKRGGFSSPNKNVDSSVYPDEITRSMATALANASTFRFDMSDQAPAAFGADAEFTQFQNFLRNPKNVNGAAQSFESAAAKAYK
jgi:ABC-type Fe3+ transport system substrate-binding protein